MRHGENHVRLQALHRAPPSSRLRRLWSQKGDLQRAWNRDRKAVWDQVGLSHFWHEGLVTVGDEALLMINHVGVTNVAFVHWTSETWWESCEIAGSPQAQNVCMFVTLPGVSGCVPKLMTAYVPDYGTAPAWEFLTIRVVYACESLILEGVRLWVPDPGGCVLVNF